MNINKRIASYSKIARQGEKLHFNDVIAVHEFISTHSPPNHRTISGTFRVAEMKALDGPAEGYELVLTSANAHPDSIDKLKRLAD